MVFNHKNCQKGRPYFCFGCETLRLCYLSQPKQHESSRHLPTARYGRVAKGKRKPYHRTRALPGGAERRKPMEADPGKRGPRPISILAPFTLSKNEQRLLSIILPKPRACPRGRHKRKARNRKAKYYCLACGRRFVSAATFDGHMHPCVKGGDRWEAHKELCRPLNFGNAA